MTELPRRSPGRRIAAVLVAAGVVAVIIGLAALAYLQNSVTAADTATDAPGKIVPGRVEPVPGTKVSRVILTADAARRLNVQTTAVRSEAVGAALRAVIPYSAVLYDRSGDTWTFTNPEPLTYVRQPVTIDRVLGDLVVLAAGPPVGTAVVTVGAAELYGTELGVGK
jgi:hypothetical protein